MEEKNNFKKLYTKRYLEVVPYFKEQKTQNYINLVLTLITFSFFGIFAINPTVSTISQLKKQLVDSQYVKGKLSEKITNLSTLQLKYSQLENELPFVFSAVPQSPSIPILFGQINALGQQSGATITRIQSSQVELSRPKDSPTKNASFVFSISAEGDFLSVMNFLSSLVNYERIISIETMSISDSEDGLKNLTVNAVAYFKR